MDVRVIEANIRWKSWCANVATHFPVGSVGDEAIASLILGGVDFSICFCAAIRDRMACESSCSYKIARR